MRLVTYKRLGVPSIGVELEDGILDIPDAASFFGRVYHVQGLSFPNTMVDLLRWDAGVDVVRQIVERYQSVSSSERPMLVSRDKYTLAAPVPRPGKIIALGLNYRDHIEETGREVPKEPVIFAKFPSSVVGPDEEIPFPPITKRLDWEVELGVVIGKTCRAVSHKEALDYVAGYTIVNDLSARDLQKRDGQWVRAKSMDGMCPMGPAIVTVDELGDGSGLRMYTKVNGELKQDSNTSNLIMDVPHIVEYLSSAFTLEPGDVIATGTPSGVGFVRDPPEYLQPGDSIEMYIEKIGYLRNRIV
ncbi:MAG: fumarylacetoacetate hydrolase family protein [Candidatus Thorarchaeota archaeon]